VSGITVREVDMKIPVLIVLALVLLGTGGTLAFMTTPARAVSIVGARQIFGIMQRLVAAKRLATSSGATVAIGVAVGEAK
jgi:hypothetical protein